MTYLPLAGSLTPFSGCYMLQLRQMPGMKQLTTCLPLLVLQTDYDDANVPSLLSIPLLGYPYDKEIYEATRRRILSSKNPLVRISTVVLMFGRWLLALEACATRLTTARSSLCANSPTACLSHSFSQDLS